MSSCRNQEGRGRGSPTLRECPVARTERWERALPQETDRQSRPAQTIDGVGSFVRDRHGHDGAEGGGHCRRIEAQRRVRYLARLPESLFPEPAARIRVQARVLPWPQGSRADSPAGRNKPVAKVRVERPPLPAFFYAVSISLASIYACRACNILGRLWAIAANRTLAHSARAFLGFDHQM